MGLFLLLFQNRECVHDVLNRLVPEITAMEKRLQVAGGLSRETPCLLETAHASLAG